MSGEGPAPIEGSRDQNKHDKDPDNDAHAQEVVRSRLLTEKELSDMAISIRELGRRLGRYQLKLDISNIFILTKAHDESLIPKTRDICTWLLGQDGGRYTIWVEETLKDNKMFNAKSIAASGKGHGDRLKWWTDAMCTEQPHTFDIILAVRILQYLDPLLCS